MEVLLNFGRLSTTQADCAAEAAESENDDAFPVREPDWRVEEEQPSSEEGDPMARRGRGRPHEAGCRGRRPVS